MAHVLVGIHDPVICILVHEVLEDEGHTVTLAEDLWQALGVLRSAQHPMLVVYLYDGYAADVLQDADHLGALAAATASGELTRHAYVQISWWRDPLPPPLQALAEQVILETLPGPFEVVDLLAAVDRAATRLAERGS